MKAFEHLRTITAHKRLVMSYCFSVGLYRQGILHDLSKFYPTEFLIGAKYYQGDRSPNNAEREKKGYSSAWLHHKGRNKHHFEYWIDYSGKPDQVLSGMKMPVNYVVEMFFDRIAACRTYQKAAYTNASPLAYFEKSRKYNIMHPQTEALLESLLRKLAQEGEEKALAYAASILKKNRMQKVKQHIFQKSKMHHIS